MCMGTFPSELERLKEILAELDLLDMPCKEVESFRSLKRWGRMWREFSLLVFESILLRTKKPSSGEGCARTARKIGASHNVRSGEDQGRTVFISHYVLCVISEVPMHLEGRVHHGLRMDYHFNLDFFYRFKGLMCAISKNFDRLKGELKGGMTILSDCFIVHDNPYEIAVFRNGKVVAEI